MEVIDYPNEEYEEIEYLEEDFEDNGEVLAEIETTPTSNPVTAEPSPVSPEVETPKRKWPKKKKKSEIKKFYKQYCYKDLKIAVEDVRSGKMTLAEAADVHGVPKKTLTHKVSTFEDKDNSTDEKHQKLLEEIKILIQYTTAVPFKSKTSRYYCFYCSTEGPHFTDIDELRTHTQNQHELELERIHLYMRPQWANEIIKVEVEDMACRFCSVFFEDWNNMFIHLAEAHYLEFDMAYTNVIPYALNSQVQCFLCSQKFTSFGQLDSHMNSHYSNYICHKCGDTFLCASRLEKHLLVHKGGEYNCEYCDKVFRFQKYKNKHVNFVHGNDTVKCLYCPEKFRGLYQRHLHVTEQHKDKVTFITCEYCGMTFTWKPYYLAHMRRRHTILKKYGCGGCEKLFPTESELISHIRQKKEKEKNFICGLCGEGFTRLASLKKHAENHLDNDFVETEFVIIG